MRKKIFQTILVKKFWEFLMFYKICLSLQVKRIIIISNKHSFYELPHVLPNDLTLSILINYEILNIFQIFIEL